MNSDGCFEDDKTSDYTTEKMYYFERILRIHLSVARNVIRKYKTPYLYVDMTSASGKIKTTDGEIIYGSPLRFLSAIQDYPDIDYTIQFIDEDNKKIDCLRKNIEAEFPRTNCYIHNGTHQSFTDSEELKFRNGTFGLIYLDLYGDFGNSIQALNQIVKRDPLKLKRDEQKPMLDILISFSGTSIKRPNGVEKYNRQNRTLYDYVNGIDKKCWLVREPYGKQQWSFLLGTYGDIFDDYKKYEFYRMDSEEGKDIFYLLNTTLDSLSKDEVNEIRYRTEIRRSKWERKYSPPQDLFSIHNIKIGEDE